MEFFSERANKKREREGEWALPAKGQTNPTQPKTGASAEGNKEPADTLPRKEKEKLKP